MALAPAHSKVCLRADYSQKSHVFARIAALALLLLVAA